jgi:hypothetical protein
MRQQAQRNDGGVVVRQQLCSLQPNKEGGEWRARGPPLVMVKTCDHCHCMWSPSRACRAGFEGRRSGTKRD